MFYDRQGNRKANAGFDAVIANPPYNVLAEKEPEDANRTLYLLSAPRQKMGMELVIELGNELKQFAPNTTIRSGDYPTVKHSLEVAVILSELTNVARIADFFDKAILYIAGRKKLKARDLSVRQLETSFGDIPSLL